MDNPFINKNLLIVEDDIEINDSLTNILKILGFHVHAVYDGDEAFDKIKDFDYDLIITDIEIPKKNGYKLIEETKKIKKYTNIIILSSYTKKMISKKINNNDIPIISKPFDLNELLNTTKKMLLDTI